MNAWMCGRTRRTDYFACKSNLWTCYSKSRFSDQASICIHVDIPVLSMLSLKLYSCILKQSYEDRLYAYNYWAVHSPLPLAELCRLGKRLIGKPKADLACSLISSASINGSLICRNRMRISQRRWRASKVLSTALLYVRQIKIVACICVWNCSTTAMQAISCVNVLKKFDWKALLCMSKDTLIHVYVDKHEIIESQKMSGKVRMWRKEKETVVFIIIVGSVASCNISFWWWHTTLLVSSLLSQGHVYKTYYHWCKSWWSRCRL